MLTASDLRLQGAKPYGAPDPSQFDPEKPCWFYSHDPYRFAPQGDSDCCCVAGFHLGSGCCCAGTTCRRSHWRRRACQRWGAHECTPTGSDFAASGICRFAWGRSVWGWTAAGGSGPAWFRLSRGTDSHFPPLVVLWRAVFQIWSGLGVQVPLVADLRSFFELGFRLGIRLLSSPVLRVWPWELCHPANVRKSCVHVRPGRPRSRLAVS